MAFHLLSYPGKAGLIPAPSPGRELLARDKEDYATALREILFRSSAHFFRNRRSAACDPRSGDNLPVATMFRDQARDLSLRLAEETRQRIREDRRRASVRVAELLDLIGELAAL